MMIKKESLGPVDRLRTAACNENKSDPIKTKRFLSTLERFCLRSPILVGRLWLKINGGNQLLLFFFDMLVKLMRKAKEFYYSESDYQSSMPNFISSKFMEIKTFDLF